MKRRGPGLIRTYAETLIPILARHGHSLVHGKLPLKARMLGADLAHGLDQHFQARARSYFESNDWAFEVEQVKHNFTDCEDCDQRSEDSKNSQVAKAVAAAMLAKTSTASQAS